MNGPNVSQLREVVSRSRHAHHGSARRSLIRVASLISCLTFVLVIPHAAVWGQSKKSGGKASSEPEKDSGAKLVIEDLEFDAGKASDLKLNAELYLDETAEGKQKVSEIEFRAREIYGQRDKVEEERRPLVGPRDALVAQITALNATAAQARGTIAQAQKRISMLAKQRAGTGGQQAANIDREIGNLQTTINQANIVISTNERVVGEKLPQLTALNAQLAPLDQKLWQLWSEMNECRKQWLAVRQPQIKYAVGDYRSLKSVLDAWLRIDGLWPEAHCWAALCAYEQGEYEAAGAALEKAGECRLKLALPKPWPQGEALRGLISLRYPGERGKASTRLKDALTLAINFKKTEWTTYFLVGRAYSERENDATRAKAQFEKALKNAPDAACVKFALARLQTTSTHKSVRDVPAGLASLEYLWERSTRRSYWMSHALVVAYDAADRKADAEKLWSVTLQLAPASEHRTLEKLRQELAAKGKSTTSE